MSETQYYYCTLRTLNTLHCVVSYPDNNTNVLALVSTGRELGRVQHVGPWDNGFSLGKPKPIRIREQEQLGAPEQRRQVPMEKGCWDTYAGCLFAIVGNAVVRMSEDGEGTVVAGHLTERGKVDGLGHAARFGHCEDIFSDGEGYLYLVDNRHLRVVKLNDTPETTPVLSSGVNQHDAFGHQQQAQAQEGGQEQGQEQGREREVLPARQQGETTEQVQVITVECGSLDGKLGCGAYDPLTCSLVLSSGACVYRLYVAGGLLAGQEAGAAAAAAAAAGAAAGAAAVAAAAGAAVMPAAGSAAPHEPVLLADFSTEPPPATADPEEAALAVFHEVGGLAVDGVGAIWVAVQYHTDMHGVMPGTQLHRIDPSGSTTRVAEGCSRLQQQSYESPTILRDGSLAMVSVDEGDTMLLLHLNLRPPPLRKACPNPSPGPSISSSPGSQTHTLGSDLGALLARQPDGSADVEVEVGGQVFAAHRSVLAARSPYFRQRLDPGAGFADAEGSRLSLPDADPGVFAAVLRYMYTDSAGAVPPELLQPVGELADRLLLPGLCAHVGQQLLWQVRPDNVVGLLLWADRHKGSFGALLSGLKDWFQGHHAKGKGGWVLCKEEVLRLMREGDLAMELLYEGRPDVRGCKRQRRG